MKIFDIDVPMPGPKKPLNENETNMAISLAVDPFMTHVEGAIEQLVGQKQGVTLIIAAGNHIHYSTNLPRPMARIVLVTLLKIIDEGHEAVPYSKKVAS